jgi:hypothetical protein
MGTRSDIIVKLSNGQWKRIYCHWDGYLSHNGKILLNHYNSQERAERLVEHGDLSSLAASCDKPNGHTFRNPVKGYCIYYGRDRGEKGVDGAIGDSLNEVYPDEGAWTEFTYVWDGHQWLVGNPCESTQTMLKLTDAMEANAAAVNPIKSYIKAPWCVLGKRA